MNMHEPHRIPSRPRFRMRLPARLACGALMAWAATSAASADTIFVNAAQILPAGFQTGNSWAFAYKDLQDALAEAVAGDEIWVAKGTYKPTATTNRAISFQLVSGVQMYGGLIAGSTSIAEADPLANRTILSGDIGGAGNADNSFHVVRANNVNFSTTLSGFVITGGNANGGGASNLGGGLRTSGSPVVVNCTFVGNSSSAGGSAIISTGINDDIPLLIVNSIVTGNTGGTAAVDIQNARAQLYFCNILGNSGTGVRFLNAGTGNLIISSIIRGNNGPGTPLEQQVQVLSSGAALVTSNIAGVGATGLNNIDADPHFVDSDGADNIPFTLDDNLRLRGSSPCIDRASTSNIVSDSADLDGDGISAEQLPIDIGGSPRRVEDFMVANGPGALNPAPDIGAFEFQRPRTILVDKDATGANNGLTWQDAYTSLQSAIAELNDVKFGGPGEIWVAEGTYKPTTTTNQTISFILPLDGQIYGGFAGGELERSQRDWIAHPTILSGEIGNQASVNDNTDTVVAATGLFYENNTLLDGVIVTGGNGGVGGGLYLKTNASPTIRNCRIIGNNTGIVFEGNQFAEPVLDNCIISGNTNRGVDITFSSAQVTNCTVAFNTAGFNSGAGIKCDSGTAAIVNCLVFGNSASGNLTQAAQIGKPSGDGLVNSFISCCAIQGFNVGYPNDVNCFAIGVDGGCVDADGADGIPGTIDDDYSPAACSDVLDAGDNSVIYPDATDFDDDGDTTEVLNQDLAGGLRRVDLAVPNTGLGVGGIDIGAFERQSLGLPDADLNNDGVVNGSDLALVLGAWETSNPEIDLNGDCIINGSDLAIVLGSWS